MRSISRLLHAPVLLAITIFGRPAHGQIPRSPADAHIEFVELSYFEPPPDGNRTFYQVTDVALGSDNSVYVLDASRWRIQVYSFAGDFQRSIGVGRKGSTCGRFLTPAGLTKLADGSLAVLDIGDSSISVFESGGRCLQRDTLPVTFWRIDGFAATPNGDFVISGFTDQTRESLYVFDRTLALQHSDSPTVRKASTRDIRTGAVSVSDSGEVVLARSEPFVLRVWEPSKGRAWSERTESTLSLQRQITGQVDPGAPPGAAAYAPDPWISSAFRLSTGTTLLAVNDPFLDSTELVIVSDDGTLLDEIRVPVTMVFLDMRQEVLAGVRFLEEPEVILYSMVRR